MATNDFFNTTTYPPGSPTDTDIIVYRDPTTNTTRTTTRAALRASIKAGLALAHTDITDWSSATSGIVGTPGATGATGATGPAGATGPQGPAGSGGGTSASPAVTTVSASGASQVLTMGTNADVCYDITLTANCALSLAGGATSKLQTLTLVTRQDGTGGHAISFGTPVAWAQGSVPVWTTAAGRSDITQYATVDGSSYFGSVVGTNFTLAGSSNPGGSGTGGSTNTLTAANPGTQTVSTNYPAVVTSNYAMTLANMQFNNTVGTAVWTAASAAGGVLSNANQTLTLTMNNGTASATTPFQVRDNSQSPVLYSNAVSYVVNATGGGSHYLNSIASGAASTPLTSAMLPTTGIVTVTAKIQPTALTTDQTIMVAGTGTSTIFNFYVNHALGQLAFLAVDTTGAFQQALSTVALPSGVTSSPLWVRATANGAGNTCSFYTSPDNVTYTQLGTAVAFANVFTFQSPALTGLTYAIGSSGFVGRIYETIFTIGSTVISDLNFTTQTTGATSISDGQSHTFTVTGSNIV